MSFVEITAEKTNDPVLISYDLSTESRFKNNGNTDEEFRAVLRVVISNEAQNVSGVSQPTSTLATYPSLKVRFNRDSLVTIYPLQDTDATSYNFNLVSQSFTPYQSKGSTFFNGTKEYVSVTPWEDLEW
jgi:hypothetical protein